MKKHPKEPYEVVYLKGDLKHRLTEFDFSERKQHYTLRLHRCYKPDIVLSLIELKEPADIQPCCAREEVIDTIYVNIFRDGLKKSCRLEIHESFESAAKRYIKLMNSFMKRTREILKVELGLEDTSLPSSRIRCMEYSLANEIIESLMQIISTWRRLPIPVLCEVSIIPPEVNVVLTYDANTKIFMIIDENMFSLKFELPVNQFMATRYSIDAYQAFIKKLAERIIDHRAIIQKDILKQRPPEMHHFYP